MQVLWHDSRSWANCGPEGFYSSDKIFLFSIQLIKNPYNEDTIGLEE
jgi:hypothetical protein